MNLIDFNKQFPDEISCKQRFKEERDKAGVVCKKCGNTSHYWLSTIEQYTCKKCGFRTTLKSGTILQNTKLPYLYWFIAIHLITTTKKPFSSLEIKRQLGHKYYEPIWLMMHKLRTGMGKRDEKYELTKAVEVDEGMFETYNPKEKGEKLKRGRGSQKQTKVLVMASTDNVLPKDKKKKNKKDKKETKLRHVKMQVIEDFKASTLETKMTKNINNDSEIKTDKYCSYSKIKNKFLKHTAYKSDKETINKTLPWVHTMIANAKRALLGIYHCVKSDYMQNYLNEFCYKVNRRYLKENLFNNLLKLTATYSLNENHYLINCNTNKLLILV